MSHIAIIVDAGHLLSGGAEALAGTTVCRNSIQINIPAFKELILSVIPELHFTASPPRYRFYWYDSVKATGLSVEQELVEKEHGFVLRKGSFNTQGTQKMVDTLLVTDMFDLAVRKESQTMYLIGGDEDLCPGVSWAQYHGAHVTCVQFGAAPCISNKLRNLCDTTLALSKEQIQLFLKHSANVAVTPQVTPEQLEPILVAVAKAVTDTATPADVQYSLREKTLPSDMDGRLLGQCRSQLSRQLESAEKRRVRGIALEFLQGRFLPLDASTALATIMGLLQDEEVTYLAAAYANRKNPYSGWLRHMAKQTAGGNVSDGDCHALASAVRKRILTVASTPEIARKKSHDWLIRNVQLATSFVNELPPEKLVQPEQTLLQEGLDYCKRHGHHANTPKKTSSLMRALISQLNLHAKTES